MSQKIEDKADAAEARTHETRGYMQQVRVAARRKYTPVWLPEPRVRRLKSPLRLQSLTRECSYI